MLVPVAKGQGMLTDEVGTTVVKVEARAADACTKSPLALAPGEVGSSHVHACIHPLM